MTEPVPSAPSPGTRGPIGEARNPTIIIVLSIVTCSIYSFFWTFWVFRELKDHNGTGLGGPVATLLWFIFSPINFFLLPSEIKKMYEADGRQSPVEPIIGLWFLLPLIGFIIWVLKVQGALNDYWVSKGAAPVS